ncbi:hypothetical protein Dimus_012103 [Dionaea muscipula]
MSLRPGARMETRRSQYKVSVDAEEGRRRREDNLVEIRKNRREESLQKKRIVDLHYLPQQQQQPSFSTSLFPQREEVFLEQLERSGALPRLHNLVLGNHKKSIKKEACWTISSITASNKEQIQAVIEAGIIAPLVHLLLNAEFDIKKEAAWLHIKCYIREQPWANKLGSVESVCLSRKLAAKHIARAKLGYMVLHQFREAERSLLSNLIHTGSSI